MKRDKSKKTGSVDVTFTIAAPEFLEAVRKALQARASGEAVIMLRVGADSFLSAVKRSLPGVT